jgi:uncharacterized protein (TIGR02246 family)
MRFSRRFIALLMFGLTTAGCAKPPTAVASAPSTGISVSSAWPADEAAIRAATDAMVEAWNRGDLKGHLASYSESVTYMRPSGPEPGVAAIEEWFTKKYFEAGVPRQSLRMTDVTVRTLGEDAALETGQYHLSGAGLPEQSGWYTVIWLRTEHGWRIVHDHSS